MHLAEFGLGIFQLPPSLMRASVLESLITLGIVEISALTAISTQEDELNKQSAVTAFLELATAAGATAATFPFSGTKVDGLRRILDELRKRGPDPLRNPSLRTRLLNTLQHTSAEAVARATQTLEALLSSVESDKSVDEIVTRQAAVLCALATLRKKQILREQSRSHQLIACQQAASPGLLFKRNDVLDARRGQIPMNAHAQILAMDRATSQAVRALAAQQIGGWESEAELELPQPHAQPLHLIGIPVFLFPTAAPMLSEGAGPPPAGPEEAPEFFGEALAQPVHAFPSGAYPLLPRLPSAPHGRPELLYPGAESGAPTVPSGLSPYAPVFEPRPRQTRGFASLLLPVSPVIESTLPPPAPHIYEFAEPTQQSSLGATRPTSRPTLPVYRSPRGSDEQFGSSSGPATASSAESASPTSPPHLHIAPEVFQQGFEPGIGAPPRVSAPTRPAYGPPGGRTVESSSSSIFADRLLRSPSGSLAQGLRGLPMASTPLQSPWDLPDLLDSVRSHLGLAHPGPDRPHQQIPPTGESAADLPQADQEPSSPTQPEHKP